MEILGFIIIIALCLGLAFAIAGICNGIENRMENKRKKAHPDLFDWFKECDEKASDSCRWYNREIAPLKRKVDAIINEMPYYPASVKVRKEVELEELRNKIHVATITYEVLEERAQEVRTRIHDYVEEHNLKWAEKQGW